MENDWGGTKGDKMTESIFSKKKKKKDRNYKKINVSGFGFFSKLKGILHRKVKQRHLEIENVFHIAN